MPPSIPKHRLVIARNERGFIVSKFGLGSRWFGATGMGSDLNGLTYAEQQVAAFPHQLTGLSVCTTISKQSTPAAYSMFGLEARDWLLYSLPERKEKMEQFLALVFND